MNPTVTLRFIVHISPYLHSDCSYVFCFLHFAHGD